MRAVAACTRLTCARACAVPAGTVPAAAVPAGAVPRMEVLVSWRRGSSRPV